LEITLNPLATATLLVSPTPTSAAPTVTSQPTIDPVFFRDEFNGALDPQWSWLREKPRDWSLTNLPGSLQINADHGYVAAHNYSNLLLRSAPAENFQLETRINFQPAINFQFAGLIIYESDSNFIQGGRAYCDAAGCVGEGFYMDYYRKGVVAGPNFGQTYQEIDPILLRMSRQGETYSFEASTDGKVWFLIGSHTSDIHPLQVGLVAGQTLRGRIIPATFEYFEVRSLP
jgi:beta-xylosidase